MNRVVSYHKQRHPGVYIFWFAVLALAVPILTVAGIGKAVGPMLTLPSKTNTHATQTIFYDRNGVKLYETAGAHQPIPVKLDQVPRTMVLATLAAEDADFYKHQGVDPQGLGRALYKNVFTSEQQGGSTITQQVIKNTYLSSERTVPRKLKEMTYAILLEQQLTKDQILERYLNEVYYGQQSYGVADAAKTYFGKELAQLDLAQSAMLAGIANAPTQYSPLGANPQLGKERQKYVLERMVKLGYISREQADAAYAEPLSYAKEEKVFHAPHFVFYVKQELAKYYGDTVVDQGGLKVYTTLDLAKQEMVEREVREGVTSVAGYNATNGAAVVEDPKTGEILAMVGSVDFNNDTIGGKVNVATAERQPGSSFKPFVYATALKQGYTPATILHDKPTTFYGTFTPKNYDGSYHGNVTMRTALGSSLNIPAVEMLDKVGSVPSIETSKAMGISTLNEPDRYGLSLVLGGGEVKLLDMTSAYGVFANKGVNPGRATVTKVVDSEGKTLYQRQPAPKPVLDEGVAFIISDMLSDNRARSIGFGANSPLAMPRQAAVKTGTTNDYKDNWTIGYTPQYVVGVWVGNNDGAPMRGISGVQGAAPIWRSIMLNLLSGTPSEWYQQPGNVIRSRGDYAIKGVNQQGVTGERASDAEPTSTPSDGNPGPDAQGRYPYYTIDANGRRTYYYQ